ncbi:hypothetical protein GIB67_028018 [Kingdonia uniflora]|uniref:Uncharacterized protein n=1 Tax=Kingdonia uniflora TaxID=39325 RepID=A0A7J7NDZ9_9MAGN|nr:hypothetical protein GIB67_028018 [Kingdonia uniflora]
MTVYKEPELLLIVDSPLAGIVLGFQISKVKVHCLNSKLGKYDKGIVVARNESSIPRNYAAAAPEHEKARLMDLSKLPNLISVYRFIRIEPMIGIVMTVLTTSILPIETISELSPAYIIGVLKVLVPMILMQIYNVGINQLYDIDIDKANKPYLPLASGELSIAAGRSITVTCATLVCCYCLSIAMGLMSRSPPLLASILTIFVVGGAYSIDVSSLNLWKNNTYLTSLVVTTMAVFSHQLAIFLHLQKYVLGKPMLLKKSIIFATAFMCICIPGTTFFKDVPDVDGDRANGTMTLSVKWGKENVFKLVLGMLMVAYGGAVVVGTTLPRLLNRIVVVMGHSIIASILLFHAQKLDLSDNHATESFYLLLWMLKSVQGFLLPFFC